MVQELTSWPSFDCFPLMYTYFIQELVLYVFNILTDFCSSSGVGKELTSF